MTAIEKLSPLIANQIAAGEVVERPASVVKELLENSIDAGSDRIQVDIERGGVRLIRITDNGSGIPKEQLALALARHATSKIKVSKDLSAIGTLGFRGEALASISSVSRLTLSSKPKEQDIGWSAHAEGNDMEVKMQPHSLPFGTIVEVRDLFFNTPARQKFLKAERTEFVHVEETVKKIALANPSVAITLKHNAKVVKRIPAANTDEQIKQRVATIIGRKFIQNTIPVEHINNDLSLSGWLGMPSLHSSSSYNQFFFVNGRPVRDKTINHAIRQAYETLLPTGRSAEYLLFFKVPADKVDVNVHPTKHEVRFIEQRLVHDYIISVLQSALDRYLHPDGFDESPMEHRVPTLVGANSEILKSLDEPQSYVGTMLSDNAVSESDISYEATLKTKPQSQPLSTNKKHYKKTTANGLWLNRFYIEQTNSQKEATLWLLDVKAYYLAKITEILKQDWLDSEVKQRPLLLPIRLQTASEMLAEKVIADWLPLGIELAQAGPQSLIIRKVPSCIDNVDVQTVLQNVLVAVSAKKNINLGIEEWQNMLIQSIYDCWQPSTKFGWQDYLDGQSWQSSQYAKNITADELSQLIVNQ